MANYYNDNPNLDFYLDHPLMKRIVELKERNFADKDTYADAPVDYEDAMENYRRVLDITGDITANIIEPNSESVDLEGPHLENGRMIYASKTMENIDACTKGGLWGVSMPRRYGGLNLPITVFSMLSEMVASADAGFQNIWSLQSCIDTLYEFGNEEQRKKYIPRVCAGETMSMDLTEPDAGSDLQSVMLKATYSEKDGCWLLNGVKRFITNGDSDIHLVLARSEEGTKDGRGLSMFIYDKRQGGVNVRHIEHKLGIHGSPTCELTYKNAKAELCGETRMGLIRYVMALMNSARLGIAAQSVGLGQEAYNEALRYAGERQQFHKRIIEFPAVYDMLSRMKAKIDAGRSLLYMTARYVDIYKCLEDIQRERPLTPEERAECKKYSRLADHSFGQGHELRVCQPERLRCHQHPRRFRLHHGVQVPAPLSRCPYLLHLRRHNAVAGGGRHPLYHQWHLSRHHEGNARKRGLRGFEALAEHGAHPRGTL